MNNKEVTKTGKWKDFLITDFFICEKGNQNNMAVLTDGMLPLVSARKCDNGYKGFVETSKKVFPGHILTLNNDGDGGAGISYYQPYNMALDSHVTALIPKVPLSRLQLLFISMCITKQRNRFGHGYSINNNRIRAFRIMLPITASEQPDWEYMESFMNEIEQRQLKEVVSILCKRLIINDMISGGVIYILAGKSSTLLMSLLRYNEVKDLLRQIKQKGQAPIFLLHHSIMVLMAS